MVRIKMPLRLIEGEKHRNLTFMKRRVVIKKKVEELGTLCDIATMLVCYGPRGQLETWPNDPRVVRGMIDLYRSIRPDDCIKRRYGLATFFECHLKKLQADLARERESWLDAWSEESLEELAQCLDAKLDAVEERMSHLCDLEEVSTLQGRETTEVGEDHQYYPHNQPQQIMPPGGNVVILDAQPIQSVETMVDFSRVEREYFEGQLDLQYWRSIASGAGAGAGAAFWEAPHHGQLPMRSQPPCALTAAYSARDPYNMLLPMLPDTQVGFSMGDVTYVDHHSFDPNRFLAVDFATYPSVASASCTPSPAVTAFPLSFAYDAPHGYSSGGGCTGTSIGNSEELLLLPQFGHRPDFDAGSYGFSLNRCAPSNTAVACNDGFDLQNELYGAGEFVQGAHTGTGTSLVDAWSGASAFFDQLPPSFCGTSDRVQVVVPSTADDSSRRVPSTAKNHYT